MTAMIPLSGGQLPSYLRNRTEGRPSVNADVAVGAQYPTLSIKGKVFTMVKDNEKKVVTRVVDGEEEPSPSINLAVLRANTKARVLYLQEYTEGDSDGARPVCSSNDGVAPTPSSPDPQAKKCAVCPHAVWGTGRNGEGTKCTVNTRLAVADPEKLDFQFLLRVPAGSRKNFSDAVKAADSRGIPYNALVMKVGFDPTAPSPKLTFKLIGLLDDAAYAKVSNELYDSEIVREIVGLGQPQEALPAPTPDGGVDTSELDAAIAARGAVKAAAAKPAPKAEPVDMAELGELVDKVAPPKVEKPKTEKPKTEKPKAEPVAQASGMEDLLGDLDTLLGNSDD